MVRNKICQIHRKTKYRFNLDNRRRSQKGKPKEYNTLYWTIFYSTIYI